ncbi:hypothetical protein ElyMa_005253800 [Elysia marginata]|uniref:Uncharacterized protein n=1 Tax=Elysia marginata TaxID=1093978 RepID=A0AAV4JZ50_9GAST|nr:hypothetical protein ElyMa_005253800 [Elysia marginata]
MAECVERLESALFDIQRELELTKEQVKNLKSERQILVEEVEQLKINFDFLKEHNNTLEQYTRTNNIRIFGVKDTFKHESAEETEQIVIKLIKKHLNINIEEKDIDSVHRLGIFKNGSDRAIIVRFLSRKTATKILANRRRLKGTGVALAEDLTRTNLDRLYKVKALEGVKSAWSKKGTIYACGQNGKILKFEPKCSLGVFNDLLKTTSKPFKQVHRPPQSTRTQGQERQLQKATIDSRMSQASVVRKSNSDGDLSAIFPTRGTHLTMNDQHTSPGPRQSTPHSEIISNGTKSITCTSVQNKLLDIANGEKED